MTATERPCECREKFEHWYALNDPSRKSVERDGFGYRLMQAHQAWTAWQAAWNARTLDAAPADPVVSADAIARKDAEIAAANAEIDELVRALKLCTQRAERAEARVDALMLEYCPDEMKEEQRAEWARNQVPAIDAARKEGV
jgi:hypothetical protein